ncbi:MAG: NAD-dependent deacylase [Deltaproteobacteria bacterium]|nr:NAD-dependent deacylase [Deltaproteobacteria bacterium]
MHNIKEFRLQDIQERLYKSKAVAILTGAGISAESGVPTFRGKNGLWKNFRPEELATPEAFKQDPRLVWEWYDWRRRTLAQFKPNAAHLAIAGIEKRIKEFTLITQNVDGLHQLAGSKNIIELHGNIWRVRCLSCGKITVNRVVPIKILPFCECGGLLRPDVVWFGEMLSDSNLTKAFVAIDNCDLMFIIGTSGIVQPAASFALRAKDEGALVVEVNIEKTPLSASMDATFIGKAGDILPQLL